MQRTADCGSPAVPKPTSTQAEKRSDHGSAPPALGESMVLVVMSAAGSLKPAAATRSIASSRPPASWMTELPSITMPTNIRIAQTVSVQATARKPPKAV